MGNHFGKFSEEKAVGVTPVSEKDSRPMTKEEIKSAEKQTEIMLKGGAIKDERGEIIATNEQIEKARKKMEDDFAVRFEKQIVGIDTDTLTHIASVMGGNLDRLDPRLSEEKIKRIHSIICSELEKRMDVLENLNHAEEEAGM